MDRRRVLSTVAAAALPLAGCLGGGRGTPTEQPTPSRTATETPRFDPEGTFETVRIGTNPGEIVPHEAGIWNAATSPRTIGIQVRDADVGETLHDRDHEFPADMALTISFREPADYRVYLSIEATDTEPTFRVAERLLDTCNESYTQVRVRPDGSIETRTMSTELLCETQTTTE